MKALVLTAAAPLLLSNVHAAFIVEVAADGLGNGNFSFGGDTTTVSSSTAVSAAVGLTGTSSAFGGNGSVIGDTYIYSYTPGSDVDNFSPIAGSVLGSTTGFGTETATGIAGGASGTYNIYWTTPSSANVNAAGSVFTITSDGADIVLDPVIGNDGGTGADLDPGPAFVGGANNSWELLATVELTAGQTYTVTQEANVNSFVSQRSHAIMWEAVRVIPEPSTATLAFLSGLALLGRRRR